MFTMTSKARITDPCHTKDISDIEVVNCVLGQWDYTVDYDSEEERVAELIAWSVDSWGPWGPCLPINEVCGQVGVDSSQVGIFCDARYPDGNVGEYKDENSFYGKVCRLTINKPWHGEVEHGCVSSSGYGDGVYQITIRRDRSGYVNAIRVTFINYNENEEEDQYITPDTDEL